ncbi:MAG: aminopeptidase [Clostridiales bacterium]|nr:aminopeptidase [Clostridiales bacterium]
MNLQENLKKYAGLILKVGLNIQPGDNLLLRFSVDGLALAREIARQAHALGVHTIYPVFSDDEMTLARFLNAPEAAFSEYPAFFVDFTEAAYKDNYHVLNLSSPNPELLKQVALGRISAWQKVTGKASERLMTYTMGNKVKWCVAALPSPAWAMSVFPGKTEEEAVSALWQKIFEATRVTEQDPVAAWQRHEAELKRHGDFLNDQAFQYLLFQAPGTDLTVYLPKGHVWMGGSSTVERGEAFMPNIPTEEIFSMPHAFKVEGTLAATKPLFTRGRMIEGIRFTFKDGLVVDFDATEGREILADMLDTDEGARRLGEVALVGDDSPISRTGLLFKNTLFDENAACHFALGQAYSECLMGADDMSPEEQQQAGMNKSLIHVDFMVGGPQLDVIGVKEDGSRVHLLKQGNWVV